MRLVGLLILCFAALAPAAVTGKLDSIGFASFIRPDCWIPVVVQTNSDEAGPHAFDLQIVQSDLDGDQVIYTRPVTVNPGVQSFWACFKPQPVNGGIPSTGNNATELSKRLRIYLSEPAANPALDKHVVPIATAGNLPQALERGMFDGHRGQKMMLVVGRLPQTTEFKPGDPRQILGTMEDVAFVRVNPKSLPVDALGYDAVDAIVWTDADLDRIDPAQLRAIRQYVRGGGRLVVIQNAETQRMGKLDEFLPVHVDSMAESAEAQPLRSILTPARLPQPLNDDKTDTIDPWRRVTGPFAIAKAAPLIDAVIDTWITWPDQSKTPFIARRLLGNGCVSWIAQDITDPAVVDESFGWPRLWERLMDWRDTELALPASLIKSDVDRQKQKFNDDAHREIGQSFQNINLDNKTAALVSLAFVFFIGYWCLAGPGSYFLLAAKKRATWNWFVFGGIALAATFVTFPLTRLVLSRPVELKHVSLVRINSDGIEPAYVHSRFGLYVPRNEDAAVALTHRDTAATPSALTPLVIDPRYNESDVSPRDSKYAVEVLADDAGASTEISVPFRSTLKKLQATWAGPPPGRISGKPVLLDAATPLSGQLSNNTGQDLKDVIIVFRRPDAFGRTSDLCLALPQWTNGLTLDLAKEWEHAAGKPMLLSGDRPAISLFKLDKAQRGPLEWAVNWLFDDLRTGMMGSDPRLEDSISGYPRSFAIASLFDRCAPMTNLIGTTENNRADILRRGVRDWDCSAAVAGGGMVILGQADGPVPLPLTVDGEPPTGTGHSFFQCVVPMDQSHFNQPTTAPAEGNP